MPGTMRKLGLYLGLVEDDEDRYDPHGYAHDDDDVTVRSHPRGGGRADGAVTRRSFDDVGASRGSVALDTAVRPAPTAVYDDPYRITTLHPRTYNEARTIGEHFREGIPVIMNLTEMDDT
ncbi:MAG: cell division protein SepF, partial [Actinomycetota bacterium]|nr:cell division protein SepF [Actinomycetota bacterium]